VRTNSRGVDPFQQKKMLLTIEDPDPGGGLKQVLARTHGISELCDGKIAKNREDIHTCGQHGKEVNLILNKQRVSVVNKIPGWGKLPDNEHKDLMHFCQVWPCRDRTPVTSKAATPSYTATKIKTSQVKASLVCSSKQ